MGIFSSTIVDDESCFVPMSGSFEKLREHMRRPDLSTQSFSTKMASGASPVNQAKYTGKGEACACALEALGSED